MSTATCWVIADHRGVVQELAGEPSCFPTQGAATDVIVAGGPMAIVAFVAVLDRECPDHADAVTAGEEVAADPDHLTCAGCGHFYDPADGEDEIFCSEECRRDEAERAEGVAGR